VVDKGSDYLRDSESITISDIGTAAGFIGQMLDVVKTVTDLASAYNQCAP
jgi:hypothetical protein